MSPTWTVRSRRERDSRKEIAERLLERQADDGGDDRGGREEGGETRRENDLKERAQRDAEDQETDDLPHERRRGNPSTELVRDVEEEEVGDARQKQSAGETDREGPVIVRAGIGQRHVEVREEQDRSGDEREDHGCRQHAAGERGDEAPQAHAHRPASLSTTPRGSLDSWMRRIAAMPEILSR